MTLESDTQIIKDGLADALDEEKIDLWVEALESDRFKQTTGKLSRNNKDEKEYCCLGVLSEVVDPGEPLHYGIVNDDQNVESTFAELNDERGLSFNEIAKIIREAR